MNRRLGSLNLSIAIFLLGVSTASAGVIFTADATTSDGAPLLAVTQGSQVIIDITVRKTDPAYALVASANNYDNTVLAFNASSSVISESLFNQVCLPTFGCFGGLTNLVGTNYPLEEVAAGPGVEVEFFAGLTISPPTEDGSVDPGVITGIAGDPQFRLVFDVISPRPVFATTINIGTFIEYFDSYSGVDDYNVTNTSVTIASVPEPTTALLLGFGLAALSRRHSA